MMGERISSESDFPKTAVYERNGPNGSVYTVAFDNREYDESWRMFFVFAWLMVLIFSLIPVAMMLPDGLIEWWIVVWLMAMAGSFFYLKQPWKLKRAIELDFGADQLRVLRNGRLDNSRRLSTMANLTVEDHPDAEVSRLRRQERRQRRPSVNEKRHCLIGWFGAGGAEQVILLTRAEWPSRHTLFEVRQAILWAIEKAGSGASPEAKEAVRAYRDTIKPPLD
jgi:hypothetical protein